MSFSSQPRVAVVGAGIAGLACARRLIERGAWVTVFDQGQQPGGRIATRRTDFGSFDVGASYFTVKDARFEAVVQRWQDDGLAQLWPAEIVSFANGQGAVRSGPMQRWVGVPGMQAIVQNLAAKLEIRFGTQITRATRREGLWFLHDQTPKEVSVSGFDIVCLAAPSGQVQALLKDAPALAAVLEPLQWEPCWAAMVALMKPSGMPFDGAFVNDDPILTWVARDSSKPARGMAQGAAERWVLHANPKWSRQFADMEPDKAAHWLTRAFAARIGRPLLPRHMTAHYWRYALPVKVLEQPCLWDATLRIGLAGDWCKGPRVEGAYLAGLALADAIAV